MKLPDTIELLLKRRSLVAKFLEAPGPSTEELDQILRCATRVPDHKGINPWRIQIVDRSTQDIFHAKLPNLHTGDPAHLEKTNAKEPRNAPLLLIVSSNTVSNKAPRSEQLLSGAAVCQNILIAAHALGYHSQWITEWMAYNNAVKSYLGISKNEEIIGFLYIGTAPKVPNERPRPSLDNIVSRLEL